MKKLRLHFKGGKIHTEDLRVTAITNGLRTPAEGKELVLAWEAKGYLKRRTDGGFDVVNQRPRPDVQTVREMQEAK